MYLHDIKINWLKHPFLRKQVKVKNTQTLHKIRKSGARTVLIDTHKGIDIESAADESNDKLEPGLVKVKQDLDKQRPQKPQPAPAIQPYPEFEATSVEQELGIAKPLRKQAIDHYTNILNDVKMGRSIATSEVENTVKDLTNSILRNQDALLTLGTIRNKSRYQFEHAINVCTLCLIFAKWLELDYDSVIQLGVAGLLHDVGETRLPDEILSNKDHLTDAQYRELQKHVDYSVEILTTNIGIAPLTIRAVQQHHERADGSGYPVGLHLKEIQATSQILGIADTYDAMTSETVYHYAMAPTHVLRQLLESGNDLFDQSLIKQFIKCLGIYPVGSMVRLNNGLIALVTEIAEQDSLHPVVRVIYNARNEHFIQPYDLNLADPLKNDNQSIYIIGCVDPNHLHIDVMAFV